MTEEEFFKQMEDYEPFKEFVKSKGFAIKNGKLVRIRHIRAKPEPDENGMVTITLD